MIDIFYHIESMVYNGINHRLNNFHLRLALVQNSRAHYLEEENIDSVHLKDFQITSGPTQGPQQNHNHHARPFIGLQHANKNSKRARYNYMEKPIKIYN